MMMKHASSLLLFLLLMWNACLCLGQPSTEVHELQQRPPQQKEGYTMHERPHVFHHPSSSSSSSSSSMEDSSASLVPRMSEPSSTPEDHAMNLLRKAATGIAACWNRTMPSPPTQLSFDAPGRCCTFTKGCVGNLWEMYCPECRPRTSNVTIDWFHPEDHAKEGIVSADLEFLLRAAHADEARCAGRVEVAFTGDLKAIVSLIRPIRCSSSSW